MRGRIMMRIVGVVFGLFLCSLCIGVVSAQVRNSTITGTVTDPSGAVVTNATVTVTNQLTNETVKTHCGTGGVYSVPYLAAGRYAVSVDAPGFKTYRVNDVAVATGVKVQANAKLAIGVTSQVVQVSAQTGELQTDTSTVSNAISSNVIENVPNITNNPLYYATLSAGVVPTPYMYDYSNLGVGEPDRLEFSAMRINGGELGTNDLQLDGVPVQGSSSEVNVMPNRDALQEVTVTTNDLSADLGGGQGIISMVTKSGTNNLHGDFSYTLRNEIFNANGLANNMQGIPRGKFRVNEGGGSIGGPVIFPKLFNGKNKVFFFVAYDRLTHASPANGFATVPTDLQREGDFSETMIHDQSGNPVPVTIYNPFTAAPYNGSSQTLVRQLYPPGPSGQPAGTVVTNPDTYGEKLLSAFPEPNHAPSDNIGDNNFYYSGSGSTTRNDLNTRLDFHFGRNSFYAAGGLQNGATLGINEWGPGPWYAESWPGNLTDDNPYATLGDIIMLSPTTFIDLHAGMTHVATTGSFPSENTFNAAAYSAYGMPAGVQSFIADYGDSPSAFDFGYGTDLNSDQWARADGRQTNYDFNGSITKVLGKLTLKGGADYRNYLSWGATPQFATPSIGHNEECYCEQYSNLNGSANGALDLIPQQYGFLGAMAPIGVMGWWLTPGSTTRSNTATKYIAFYTQNDWKATKRLTVNLGLRYEIQPGPTQRHNTIYDVDLNVPNPYTIGLNVADASPLAQMGAIAFAGQGSYSRNEWNTQWNNISPRLGVAYRLTESMVARGGYGRIYAPSNEGEGGGGLLYGGAAFSGGVEPIPFGLSPNGSPVGRFEDTADTADYPAAGAVQNPDLYGDANASNNVDYFLRNGYLNTYFDQWNFFLERRFKGWLASAGYVGSKGTHLGWRQYPLNGPWNIPAAQLATWRAGWIASNGTNDPAQVQIPNPVPALVGFATGDIGNTTISTMESQEPYLGFLGQTAYKSIGSSRYDSLNLELKHSYASGMTAQFSYVWSKAEGIAGGYYNETYPESNIGSGAGGYGDDFVCFQCNKSILSFDVPERFVGVMTYALPFGAGKRFDPGNAAARELVGGWQLGTVVTLQSGEPWGPVCYGSLNGHCFSTDQPLKVPKSDQHWYDGNTSVTLPDGRIVIPNEYSYLMWNPDAFASQMVQLPNGSYSTDQYWNGTTKMYMGALRMPYFMNTDLNISKSFKLREQFNLEILSEASNLFNRTNFWPYAVDNNFPALSVADPSTGSAVGENSDNNAGTLYAPGNTMFPRQVTFTARLKF